MGRNVAEMELALIVGTVCGRYGFVLREGKEEGEGGKGGEWKTREGFLRKPLGLRVGLKRRW